MKGNSYIIILLVLVENARQALTVMTIVCDVYEKVLETSRKVSSEFSGIKNRACTKNLQV